MNITKDLKLIKKVKNAMKSSELINAVKLLVGMKRPVMISSAPGIGKSSLVRQAAKEMNMGIIDLRAALLDTCDLLGVPNVTNGATRWNPPDYFPFEGKDNGKGIIFLDELPQATPSVQAALSQAILDHAIGQKKLDPNWTFVAAGNRMEDRAATHRTPSHINNRLIHLDLDINTDDWIDWAEKNNIATEIRMFIKFKPGLLSNFEADRNARAYATPRSWEFLSQIVMASRGKGMGFLRPLADGTVGSGPSAEFCAFLGVWESLPSAEEVFGNPEGFKIPDDKPSVMWALVGMLSDRIRNEGVSLQRLTPSNADYKVALATHNEYLDKYLTIGARFPGEWSMMAIQEGMTANGLIMARPNFQTWAKELNKRGLFNNGGG